MKYSFKDIDNEGMLTSTAMMFIAGPYSIFNNMINDKLREMCKGSINLSEDTTDLMDEFSVSDNDDTISNSLDFGEFMEVVKVPAVTGKWFCSVDFSVLSKRHKDVLDRYYKRPNKNGVLVVTIQDFADYKMFLRNRILGSALNSHLIQLSFPNRTTLVNLVTKFMGDRGVTVAQKAAELFVMRMSASYDEYAETIDNVCLNRKGQTLTYPDMIESLKGIDNYILEDFLIQLTVPMKSHKIVSSRKIYKMEAAMLEEFGERQLVNKLRYKVEDMIDMRMLINKGIVPIRVKYSVPESKRRMGEEHRLNKLSDFAFKKLASVACRTSLKDWMFIKMILNSADSKWSDTEYERIVHILVNRSVFCESRIMNDIGITDIVSEGLFEVNKMQYSDNMAPREW